MAENFTGLNVSTQQGEGAANVLQWGATDKAINQLYAEQKQREARGYNEYQMGQSALAKEMANVRSADVPELRQLYDQQKQLRQEMLFNPKLKRDRDAYSQVEQQYNATLSKLQQGIRGSVETMDFDKGLSQDMYTNRDLYEDNAAGMHQHIMQLPTSQRNQLGLNTADPFLYKGVQKGFSDIDKAARGEVKPIFGKQTLSQDQQYFQTPSFNANNDAAVYKDNFYKGLEARKAGQDAAVALTKITPAQFDAVSKAYDNLPESEYSKWGKPKPNLEPTNPDDKAEVFASYMAKKYAVENIPKQGETKTQKNEEYFDRLNKGLTLSNDKIMEGIRQGNRRALIDYREHFKKLDKAQQGEFLDNYINSLYDDAKKSPKEFIQNGQKSTQYDMKASTDIKKLFGYMNAEGHLVYPDRVRLLENGDVQPIFFKKADGNKIASGNAGKALVNEEKSVPMLKEEFRARIGKQLLGQKEANSQLGNDDDESGYEYDQEIKVPVPANSIPSFLKK